MTAPTLKQRRAAVAQRRRARVGGDLFTQPEWAQYLGDLDELFDAYSAARRERYDAMRAGGQRITRADLPWRTSSEQVYWDLWVAFTARLVAHMRRLEDVDRAFLAAYLAHLAQGTGLNKNLAENGRLQPRYARRVLSLIDRLSRYDAERRGIPANPAVSELLKDPEQEVLREANRREHDELPEFLDAGDRERVKELLMLPVGSPAADGPATWRELRDNAAVAVQLGAGLAPGEVRALRLQDVDGERRSGYSLRVRASGNRHQRSNALAAWAGGALAAWLKARQALKAADNCPYVFCTDDGTQWSKNKAMQATAEVLVRAKVRRSYGAYQLRHTYVVTARQEGASWEDIGAALGISKIDSWSLRYQAVMPGLRSKRS